MTAKRKFQILTDFAMITLLPLLMAYNLIGEAAHEWIGALMFLLFLCHHLLNRHWHKSLTRGKYSPSRVLSSVVNLLLLIIMLALMWSGIMQSKHLFVFFPQRGGASIARTVHLAAAYWGFAIMSFHTGLHGGIFLKMGKKMFPLFRTPKYGGNVARIVVVCISIYGIYAFLNRHLGEYMLLKTQYVFFDFNEPLFFFMMDYISIMLLLVFSGYYVLRFLIRSIGEK